MERPHAQVLTLVLQAFKDNGGLDAITEIMKVFYEEVKTYTGSLQVTGHAIEKTAQATSAYGGIKIILGFLHTDYHIEVDHRLEPIASSHLNGARRGPSLLLFCITVPCRASAGCPPRHKITLGIRFRQQSLDIYHQMLN